VSPSPKAKRLKRKSLGLTRGEATQEDDAEQALKEILAARTKLTTDAMMTQEVRVRSERKIVFESARDSPHR
jgi:hypothetical protein